ncbi:MAG TPA: hypothetical protein VGE41_04105, partial [Verrucomicrobiae bacterium]
MTPRNSELAAEMQRLAQMHTQMAKNVFELSLDYSEESLRKIDEAITTFDPDGNALEISWSESRRRRAA